MSSPTDSGAVPSMAELRRRLEELRQEHRDLDDAIASLHQTAPFNQLQLQRLKKRKLQIKDRMEDLRRHLDSH